MNYLFGIGIWWWNANAFYGAHLARALSEHEHKVIMTARKDGPPFTQSQKLGLVTKNVNYDTGNPFKLIAELFKLRRVINNFKPDYLIPVTSKAHFLMTMVKIIFFPDIMVIRIVADVRSPKPTLLNKWFYNKWTDFIVASADVCKKRVISNTNYSSSKLKTIYLGYSHKEFYRDFNKELLRKKYGIKSTDFLVLHIGRFAKEKDPQTFINAMGVVAKKYPNAKAIMSGEELHFKIEELRELAVKVGAENQIIFLNRIDDVRELIFIGNVGVVTSTESEVVCRIITEYMIYGLPVIGTNINVIPEMVENGKNGLIFQAGNFIQLSESIIEYIMDIPLCEKTSKENIRKAREIFSYDKFYTEFMAVSGKF